VDHAFARDRALQAMKAIRTDPGPD
jgi:hypothetical protein